MFNIFIDRLEEKLKEPLPGLFAHLKMASESRLKWIREMTDASLAMESSILILLFPDDHLIKTVFILRPDNSGVHSRQVSFPGGRHESCDITLFDTALREANEEIGVNISEIRILGHLTNLYIPPSNFNVFPVVGAISDKPAFRADENEVDRIIEVNLMDLLDDRNMIRKEIEVHNVKITVPCFELNGVTIWGATAMILSEFLEVVKTVINDQ
ncbi:MAG: CoA pyrophosphatase [Bacteroidetes bacterium]|nr:CoA pyrophosphatase [Bacteroidota bacterium]